MRPITLHPASVLIGFALAGLLVVVGAAQAPALVRARPGDVETRVLGIPDPSRLVEVREENSLFSVPEGQRLVLVWSWVEGPSGVAEQNVQLKDSGGAVFLDTAGSDYSGRVFLDGPRTFRVQDINGSPNLNARLVGYLVDVERAGSTRSDS